MPGLYGRKDIPASLLLNGSIKQRGDLISILREKSNNAKQILKNPTIMTITILLVIILSVIGGSKYTNTNKPEQIKQEKKVEKKEVKEEPQEDTASDKEDLQHESPARGGALELPTGVGGEFKSYTDYRMYTLPETKQYQIQRQCWTDENGLRRYNTDYCISVGSGYGLSVGDRVEIHLGNGAVFTAIIADSKMDIHTDSSNKYIEQNGNILEFIVDSNVLPPHVQSAGSIGAINFFNGEIKEMYVLQ